MGEPHNIHRLATEFIIDKSPTPLENTDDFIKTIGIRPGEVLHESLMFEEEKKKAIKKGKYFIIK